jgi:hypothetical protein
MLPNMSEIGTIKHSFLNKGIASVREYGGSAFEE